MLAAAVAAGGLPDRFVVTWPKITSVAQVRAAVLVAERLEAAHGLPDGAVRLELQVEMPQAVLGADGTATVAACVQAGAGRVEGLHYGTYDYSAALGVGPLDQALDHPLADHAKAVMQLAAAQTGVRVSDGSTNVLPVGTDADVRAALALHARLVTRAQARALRQGWDLHPAQLVTRYAATFLALRAELDAGAARLRAYAARASDAVGAAGPRRAGHRPGPGRGGAARRGLRRGGPGRGRRAHRLPARAAARLRPPGRARGRRDGPS